MTRLRTLSGVAEAVRRLGIERVPTQLAEFALYCPIYRDAGLKSLAYVEAKSGALIPHCVGCECAGDDPDDIVFALEGHPDPWHGDPCEVLIRWFDLQYAIARADEAAA